MGLDTKTYWLTDRHSQCDFDFDFDFDLKCSVEKSTGSELGAKMNWLAVSRQS
jgi:hypothetical protein